MSTNPNPRRRGSAKSQRQILESIVLCSASLAMPSALLGQVASVAFEDSVAVYGPDIYPAVTRIRYCEPYRVLVAYINGTDMLFVDELELAENQSTFQILRGVSVIEFNAYEQSAEIRRVTCAVRDGKTLQVTGLAHSLDRKSVV